MTEPSVDPAATAPVTAPEVVSAPTVAPAIEPVSTPAPTPEPVAIEPSVDVPETPAVDTPAAVDTAPADKPALHTDTPTLLEGIKEPGSKPAADAKPVDAPAADIKPTVAYEDFTVPEGVTFNAEKMGAYKEALGKYNVPQEAAQEFMNMHADAIKEYAANTLSEQHRVFGETRKGWRDQVLADDVLGGAGHQTAMQTVARGRDVLIKNIDKGEFENFLRITGAGDHPVFLRMMHEAARRYDEPAAPATIGTPPPTNGKPPGKGRLRDIYNQGKN